MAAANSIAQEPPIPMSPTRLLVTTSLLIASTQIAAALPIDCSKAASQNERAICADPFLLQTDARLDTLYDIASRLVSPAERDSLVDTQRAWVRERDQCGTDKNCMRAAYAKRASVFESILQRAQARGPF